MEVIKALSDNRKVIFDKGNFDNWCIYVVEANGVRKAPFDATYFAHFKEVSSFYPNNKVYLDFVSIYDVTTNNLDIKVIYLIDEIVKTYNEEHKIIMEQWLTVVYAGMIAEENKVNSKLKKRIKRLGMFQLLMEGMLPSEAADFSKGKGWELLDAIMKKHDF